NQVKVMHINMNILNTYTINVLAQINLLTRLILMGAEHYDMLDGISDMIISVSLMKTFVWVSMYNYVSFITYAALMFSTDYETNRRVWVSCLIIFGNSLFSGIVTFVLEFDFINGVIYVLITFCFSNLSCVAFMLIKAENIREDIRLNSFHIRKKSYTVSLRWQVKDNVRVDKDTRFLVVGAAVQISFYLPFFFVPPLFLGENAEWRSTLELSKALFQLLSAYGFGIAELFVLFAFSRHKEFVKSALGRPTT
ncbi:hypothetical protein PMAYCL1PPCAC_17447, partial [Pristionchus mayeri]